MLTDRALQLLTAFVDGDLSRRQRKSVTRLLHKSSEARQVVKDLQENVHRLQQLPKLKVEASFADHVMRLIHEKADRVAATEEPRTLPILPRQSRGQRWQAWSRYAVAASLAAILAVGGYLVTRPTDQLDSNAFAKNDKKNNVDHSTTIANLVGATAGRFSEPVRADRPGAQFAFADLKEEGQAGLLTKELTKAKAVHLELTVKNRREAVAGLASALRAQGINLIVDKNADAQLSDAQTKSEFVLVAENVSAAELTALLGDLGKAPNFETVVVSPVTGADEKQVCQLLGIEGKEWGTPLAAAPIPKIMPKEAPNPNQPGIASIGTPSSIAPRQALVLSGVGRGGAPLSAHVRSFLSQRQELRPGTLQVVIVIHQG